jgi:hypothetical protein
VHVVSSGIVVTRRRPASRLSPSNEIAITSRAETEHPYQWHSSKAASGSLGLTTAAARTRAGKMPPNVQPCSATKGLEEFPECVLG